MLANGEGLDAAINLGVSVTGLQRVVILNLPVQGMPHFVWLARKNSFGIGSFAL